MECVNKFWSSKAKLFVSCGNCMPCRVTRARDWAVRMLHESSYYTNSVFVTLTYNEVTIPADGSIDKKEFTDFVKRLRRRIEPRKIKYFACGEYGENNIRPHYHAIFFGVSRKDKAIIDDCWNKGFIYIGSVSYQSARYVADYVLKSYKGERAKEIYGDKQTPFVLVSKNLGERFCMENADQIKQQLGCTVQGKEVGLPKYYRKKLNLGFSVLLNKVGEVNKKRVDFYKSMVYNEAERRIKSHLEDPERILKKKEEMRKRKL